MNINRVIDICTKAIPQKETWKSSKHESYGAYNVEDDRMVVSKILYCVTPSSEIVEYAKENGYDMIIGHHPFVIPGIPSMVFHTALDMVDNGGLNWQWKEHLKMKNAIKYEDNLGWFGEIEPVTYDELLEQVKIFTGGYVIGQQKRTDKIIKTVISCSGLGGFVQSIVEKMNPDCFITGELLANVNDLKLDSVIETGHTYSEQCGVNLFRDLLEKHQITVDLAPIYLDRFGKEYFGAP